MTAILYPTVCQIGPKLRPIHVREILFKNMKLKLVALNIKRVKYTRTTKQNNKTCVAKNDSFSSEFGNESMEKELK